MLDRSKVMRELRDISDKLFVDISPAFERAQSVWDQIISDPSFLSKVCTAQEKAPWLLPTWIGALDDGEAIRIGLNELEVIPDGVLGEDGAGGERLARFLGGTASAGLERL